MAEIQQTRTESVELLLAQLTQASLDEREYRLKDWERAKQAEAEYSMLYDKLEKTGVPWRWTGSRYDVV